MKCKEAKILLSAGVDGELTPSEELALERHVTSCAGCAKDKVEFARLSGAMPLWADAEPSPWLAEKFAYKLAELQEYQTERAPGKRLRWVTLSAATAGLTAAVLVIGLLIHSNVPPAKEAPMQATVKPQTKVVQPMPADKIVVAQNNPVKPPAQAVRHRVRKPALRYVANKPKPEKPVVIASLPTPPLAPAGSGAYDAESNRAVTLIAKSTVSENLGEASLAMNDTIERVRGNLQKSVDIMVSQPPVPVTDSTHTNGGTP